MINSLCFHVEHCSSSPDKTKSSYNSSVCFVFLWSVSFLLSSHHLSFPLHCLLRIYFLLCPSSCQSAFQLNIQSLSHSYLCESLPSFPFLFLFPSVLDILFFSCLTFGFYSPLSPHTSPPFLPLLSALTPSLHRWGSSPETSEVCLHLLGKCHVNLDKKAPAPRQTIVWSICLLTGFACLSECLSERECVQEDARRGACAGVLCGFECTASSDIPGFPLWGCKERLFGGLVVFAYATVQEPGCSPEGSKWKDWGRQTVRLGCMWWGIKTRCSSQARCGGRCCVSITVFRKMKAIFLDTSIRYNCNLQVFQWTASCASAWVVTLIKSFLVTYNSWIFYGFWILFWRVSCAVLFCLLS